MKLREVKLCSRDAVLLFCQDNLTPGAAGFQGLGWTPLQKQGGLAVILPSWREARSSPGTPRRGLNLTSHPPALAIQVTSAPKPCTCRVGGKGKC